MEKLWETNPGLLYGKYKDENGLSEEEINDFVQQGITVCCNSQITMEEWFDVDCLAKVSDLLIERLPKATAAEEDYRNNFLNDHGYLVVKLAIEEKLGIKIDW